MSLRIVFEIVLGMVAFLICPRKGEFDKSFNKEINGD